MQRQRIPSLDTTNPVGWFTRFLAITATLGCSMAFSHEAIEDMNTQTAYAKVEAETPVAKDSAAYDKQRDRKKNAAKASEANATLAGFIRLAVLDDPSAQQTVMGAIGMAGKDGVLALQALWASYGPKGRLPFTQQAFDQYVHTRRSISYPW